jgi:hypothetical protein
MEYNIGGYKWNILFDCDIWLSPVMYNVIDYVPPNSIGSYMEYDPSITIKEDEYIKLDHTDRIPATNCLVVPNDLHDIWKPFDLSLETALSRMKRPFVIDEYCIGRNLKKMGIRWSGVIAPEIDGYLFKHFDFTTKGRNNVT